MEQIWKILAEVLVEPGDFPSGPTKGFMNVTTWADSAESASKKLADYFKRFNWHVLCVENSEPIIDGIDYGEQIEEMIARTRDNPEAIILGTFHGYKEN